MSTVNTPAAFKITLNYVNGDGNRTSLDVVVRNDSQMTEEAFQEFIHEHIGSEEIVAAQWELPNLSPVQYDWVPSDGLDHAYLSMSDIAPLDSLDMVDEEPVVLLSHLQEFAQQGGSPRYLQAKAANAAMQKKNEIRTTALMLRSELPPHQELIDAARVYLERHGYMVSNTGYIQGKKSI